MCLDVAVRWKRNRQFFIWWETVLEIRELMSNVYYFFLIFNLLIFAANQYAVILFSILVIELIVAGSLYTYKDHLADGLQKGLNQSIRNYGPQTIKKSAEFDAMQENVKTFFSTNCCEKCFQFSKLFSWAAVEI